jgi:hypothetical protein
MSDNHCRVMDTKTRRDDGTYILKYMCGGIHGCEYFNADKGKYDYMTARCEHYIFKTGECVCSKAISNCSSVLLF